jgi:Ca2+-transporting ATPase
LTTPADPDIMAQKPRPRKQSIFTKPVLTLMVISGVWSMLINLGIFMWALDVGRSMLEAQCLTFLTLIITEFVRAYNFRSEKESIFKIGIFNNQWLNLAIVSQIPLIIVIIYVPLMQELFRTFSLSVVDWVIVILVAGSIFPVLEMSKAIIRWRDVKAET